jgi:surface carbohydrate biosynthesis protein
VIRRLDALARVVALCCRREAWRPVETAPVVLVFPVGADVLRDAHPEVDFVVLDPRETAVHAPTALACLARGRASVGAYLDAMLRRMRPRVVVTFVDNFEPFLLLKARHPDVTFVTVQNGVRGLSGDLLGALDADPAAHGRDRHVDHAFVFGAAIGDRFATQVRARYHPVGSFKSNAVPVSPTGEDLMGFVSTRRTEVRPGQRVAIHDHDSEVRQEAVYAAYDAVAAWAYRCAKARGLRLLVIGKDEDPEADRRHYARLFRAEDFEYSARARWDSSYRALDRCRVALFTSSSLGYEALARGVRVGALLTWTAVTGSSSDRFGWPLDLAQDGPFWTHHHDELRFTEIFGWLLGASDEEWRSAARPIVDRLIATDPGNTRFLGTLREASRDPADAHPR